MLRREKTEVRGDCHRWTIQLISIPTTAANELPDGQTAHTLTNSHTLSFFPGEGIYLFPVLYQGKQLRQQQHHPSRRSVKGTNWMFLGGGGDQIVLVWRYLSLLSSFSRTCAQVFCQNVFLVCACFRDAFHKIQRVFCWKKQNVRFANILISVAARTVK